MPADGLHAKLYFAISANGELRSDDRRVEEGPPIAAGIGPPMAVAGYWLVGVPTAAIAPHLIPGTLIQENTFTILY